MAIPWRTGRPAGLIELRRPIEAAHSKLVQAICCQSSANLRDPARVRGRPPEHDPMWAQEPKPPRDGFARYALTTWAQEDAVCHRRCSRCAQR